MIDVVYMDVSKLFENILCMYIEGQFVIKERLLRSIKVDKSSGPDVIYSGLLREARGAIAGALKKDLCVFPSHRRGTRALENS